MPSLPLSNARSLSRVGVSRFRYIFQDSFFASSMLFMDDLKYQARSLFARSKTNLWASPFIIFRSLLMVDWSTPNCSAISFSVNDFDRSEATCLLLVR
jgi:hypothetical protein